MCPWCERRDSTTSERRRQVASREIEEPRYPFTGKADKIRPAPLDDTTEKSRFVAEHDDRAARRKLRFELLVSLPDCMAKLR